MVPRALQKSTRATHTPVKKKRGAGAFIGGSAAKGVKKRVSKKGTLDRETILRALRRHAAHAHVARPHQLERHDANPIVEPRPDLYWEMKATFNPGALYADRRIHLLYRAIGGDDISVLGYASSEDGINFNERLDEPAYVPPLTTGKPKPEEVTVIAPAYCSGGGWNGGCEDPRLTKIGDDVYLMYTAFDGWGSVRVAVTSIGIDDFLHKRWNWEKPALISPPGEVTKNWVLFPEKINGKFAILHSVSPEVLVDYFDDLEELRPDEVYIKSKYSRAARPNAWDTWVRGAGPPPIKTKLGWLLFYHAMDIRDPDRYKLGAMILDLNDPTRVLYRTRTPILEPDAYYENAGFKSGVVYSCGAVVKDGELYVYYGGGDTVTCVAMANLDKFLDDLKMHGTPHLAAAVHDKKTIRSNARR